MIVGLTGKKQHGKDTTGAILVNEHGFVRVSFADALKQSAAALFGVPVETWDALKNRPDAIVTLNVGAYVGGDVLAKLTVREFLQRYGTEAHRDVFGGTFWTDVAEERIVAEHSKPGGGSPIVFTDVRFPEEAALVKEYGGTIVRVVRPTDDASDTHASEKVQESIVADFELWNGGTIEDLKSAVAFDIIGKGLGGGQLPASQELARRFTT